jgi:hypothetical protein
MKINNKFEHVEVETLYFKEPTARSVYLDIKVIKGYIMKSILSIPQSKSNNSSTSDNENISAKELLAMISLDEESCEKFYGRMEKLLCHGFCFVDESMEQRLSKPSMDLMDNESLDCVIESYLDFFSKYFVPSKS